MKNYEEFEEWMRKLSYLNSASGLLSWDQEVFMPSGANEYRAQTSAYLSTLSHKMFVDPKLGKLLTKLSKDKSLSFEQKRNVEIELKNWKRSILVPGDYIQRSSYATSMSYDNWVLARKNNDFASFVPSLEKVIDLQKEWVSYINWEGKTYDALLDSYEKGLTMEILDKVFEDLKEKLIPFIGKTIKQTSTTPPLKGKFDIEAQRKYTIGLLEKIGYDLNRGRVDESPHPFSSAFHPTDSRITSSYDDKDLQSIWSTMHEAGHGMYEQGLIPSQSHLATGSAISLSIHESQSRFWENMIGKNLLFWKNEFSNLRDFFKEDLAEVSYDSFWKSINKVEAIPIRIDSDELTYHLHIIIRYEIEKAIFEDNYPVKDLNKLWNEKYKEYLGIDIATDANGVLQDVHWSCGMFGYFPTYTLGSMYSAQFYDYMKKNFDIEDKLNNRDYHSIKKWLNENIHELGGIYTAEELCEKVTGEKLKASYFIDYIKEKYEL